MRSGGSVVKCIQHQVELLEISYSKFVPAKLAYNLDSLPISLINGNCIPSDIIMVSIDLNFGIETQDTLFGCQGL
jgi:hypothetical protein